MNKALFFTGLGIVIILLFSFGLPNEINIFGATWCIKDCDKDSIIINNISESSSHDMSSNETENLLKEDIQKEAILVEEPEIPKEKFTLEGITLRKGESEILFDGLFVLSLNGIRYDYGCSCYRAKVTFSGDSTFKEPKVGAFTDFQIGETQYRLVISKIQDYSYIEASLYEI